MSMGTEENIYLCMRQQTQSGILGLRLKRRRRIFMEYVGTIQLLTTKGCPGLVSSLKRFKFVTLTKTSDFQFSHFYDMMTSEMKERKSRMS